MVNAASLGMTLKTIPEPHVEQSVRRALSTSGTRERQLLSAALCSSVVRAFCCLGCGSLLAACQQMASKGSLPRASNVVLNALSAAAQAAVALVGGAAGPRTSCPTYCWTS